MVVLPWQIQQFVATFRDVYGTRMANLKKLEDRYSKAIERVDHADREIAELELQMKMVRM